MGLPALPGKYTTLSAFYDYQQPFDLNLSYLCLFLAIPAFLIRVFFKGWLRHRPLPDRRAALLYGRPEMAGLTRLQVDGNDVCDDHGDHDVGDDLSTKTTR